jgi:hypothetical protein
MKEQMEAEGFVNATRQSRRMPVGAWPSKWCHNEAGLLFQKGMLGDIRGLSLKIFLDGLQWSRAKMELLLNLWKFGKSSGIANITCICLCKLTIC